MALATDQLPVDDIRESKPATVEIVRDTVPAFERFRKISPVLPAENRIVGNLNIGDPATEAFRLMAVRLRHIRKDRQLKRLLITSSLPEEGKSLISANLACSIAASDEKILLIEGDVRRPSIRELFQLSHMPGLCEYLQDLNQLEECIYRLDQLGFCLLPAGRCTGNPLQLLQSPRLGEKLDQLSCLFDWIIIDSPPALPLADTSILSRLCDGILLVTRRGTTQKQHLERVLESLEQSKLLGAVINSSRKPGHDYYYYYGVRGGPDATDTGV
ncbi:MAG TPA: CpsD/CapB family tyrosine-protein kinase [Acidobacteriaceae bacterium]|nr:CpsD/CapB family tyrosine-protein kinase [Acidobacteriaceae bacterium]